MPVDAVRVRGLVKSYAGRAVVDRLDLTAPRGAVTAVLGPNGAGKTTTIECCEGLRRQDAGTIEVLGLNPLRDAAQLHARVGVMLQDGGLPNSARAQQVLALAAAMHAAPADVVAVSARLGIDAFARTPVRRLSGGQRQRLALAVAIIGRPELVFLDEPSAGLDPQSRHAVWELVRELRDGGTSVVLTTHLMDEAEQLADLVHVVDSGSVIASGAPDELITAHGGPDSLAVTIDRSLGDDELAALAAYLSAASGTLVELGVGRATHDPASTVLVHAESSPALVAELAAWCRAEGVLITSLRRGARSLEDTFLELTGREMR